MRSCCSPLSTSTCAAACMQSLRRMRELQCRGFLGLKLHKDAAAQVAIIKVASFQAIEAYLPPEAFQLCCIL